MKNNGSSISTQVDLILYLSIYQILLKNNGSSISTQVDLILYLSIYQVLLKNNGSSISTQVDPTFSEVYLKLNVHDFQQTYQVKI